VSYRSQLPDPGIPPLVSTYLFNEDGGGNTRIEARFGRPKSAKHRAIFDGLLPAFDAMMAHNFAALGSAIDAEMASGAAAAVDAAPEPELTASANRNLREPILRTG
jgi:hypothetical protein